MSSGCWTCKLREVDCDGKRLRCLKCEDCGLVCEGYGPKPSWMDDGQIQQDYLQRLESIADYNSKRKGRECQNTILSNSSNAGEDDNDEHGDPGQNEEQGDLKEASSTESTSPESKRSEDTQSSIMSDVVATPSERGVTWCQPDAWALGVQPAILEDPEMPNTADIGIIFPHLNAVIETESSVDEFALHFPFYGGSNHDRGWFHLLMLRSELVRCSSLALAHHWSPSSLNSSNYGLEPRFRATVEAACYKSMSLAMLQEQIKEVGELNAGISKTRMIEILVSIMNIIILEVLEANSDQWRVHLAAGIGLLQSKQGDDSQLTTESDEASTTFSTTAQAFLGSVFVGFDALSSALFWDDKEQCNHAAILHRWQASDTSFFGCKNWVVVTISQTNQLRRWKTLMIEQGSLSNVLLVSRASQLQSYIATQLLEHGTGLQNCDEVEVDLATYVSAQAAMIYLHVLMSGPHPDIPEIRYSVENCLPQIEKAILLGTLPWLAWSTCIIGCMAATNLRNAYETSLERMDKLYGVTSGYARALATMRECWRLRDADACPAHWASAMQSLGITSLLI